MIGNTKEQNLFAIIYNRVTKKCFIDYKFSESNRNDSFLTCILGVFTCSMIARETLEAINESDILDDITARFGLEKRFEITDRKHQIQSNELDMILNKISKDSNNLNKDNRIIPPTTEIILPFPFKFFPPEIDNQLNPPSLPNNLPFKESLISNFENITYPEPAQKKELKLPPLNKNEPNDYVEEEFVEVIDYEGKGLLEVEISMLSGSSTVISGDIKKVTMIKKFEESDENEWINNKRYY